MIRINLIPPEYEQAQARQEQRLLFGSAGGVAIVLMLLFLLIKKTQANSLEKKIVDSEAKLRQYQAIIAQIDSIEAKKSKLISKREVIKNLNQNRLIYPVFFEDLLPLIPSDVWVTNVTLEEQGGTRIIKMTSNALSNFALATWLSNLEQSTHFSNINLSNVSYTHGDATTGSSDVLGFTLEARHQHQGPMPLTELN